MAPIGVIRIRKAWAACFLALCMAGCLFGCGANTGGTASGSASMTASDSSASALASVEGNEQVPEKSVATDESSNSGQVEAAGEVLKPVGARKLYRAKLQELVDTYGAPEYMQVEGGAYISGLSFARLINLGLGHESLAVAYLDPSKESSDAAYGSKRPGEYVFEIWDAEPDGDAIELLFTGGSDIDGQNIYCSAIMATEHDGRWFFSQLVERPGYPPSRAFFGLLDDGSIGRCADANLEVRYPDDYEIYRLESLNTSNSTIDLTIRRTNELIEELGADDVGSPELIGGSGNDDAAAPELKDHYSEGEHASFAGVLHVTSQGPSFAGKGLWAYVELPRTVTFSGGSYYERSEQSRLQVGLAFSFDSVEPGELSLPDWEPYDGSEVVVSGRVEAVSGMSSNQLEPYRLADAVLERVLSSNGASSAPEAAYEFNTPYYKVAIPAGWPDGRDEEISCESEVEGLQTNKATNGEEFGLGCIYRFNVGSGYFFVGCFTDNHGPQGSYTVSSIGTPENLPGWHVSVFTPSEHAAGELGVRWYGNRLAEVESFVTLVGSE